MHPRMGRPFMGRQPDSVEAKKQYARLRARIAAHAQPGDMREYLMADYLVLYACLDATHDRLAKIYLLAIKHYKHLSFDFERLGL
jgi:hypothetical protein